MTPSRPSLRFAGVVPAAGASRRMGRSKALLDLGGRSFLERVVGALRGGGCDPVVVVVAEGDAPVRRVAEAHADLVLVNVDPGEGPITSLRLALAALPDAVDGIAWLPVDHAIVGPDAVLALLSAAAESGADLTLPVFGEKRGHPAVFRRTLFGELADTELVGGARVVVHRHLSEAHVVSFEHPSVVEDIDTPEAYARVREILAEEPAR